ncbi:hypothetical protein [Streptomyces sp. CB01881]|uniref:hypothetical protein n=1 Tax=Streptomyces sp. CB01881 TaxID=2078691 RepID=UPI000CDBE32D|nr:hypothetical protein [Streptomyces sp. CB01881]AUY53021.1 hypothetical protein C2142_33515 [Streptomyces sp. CB01881]TYC70737.1 hypothetical protein EH183_33575 [Streptomyces sp. CB01881]
MEPTTAVPERRLGPYPLNEDGIASLLARYEFGDSCLRRVILDQEYGARAARGRLVRLVIDARVVSDELRWEPVCLDLVDVQRFRIDESVAFSWVLYDPPQFTHFDGLLQVDLCAERFGAGRPASAEEVFEGSELVFAAAGGTWSALQPWAR